MSSDKKWAEMSLEEKNIELYYKQVEVLNLFLERNAISKAQYEKSLSDLTAKMKIKDIPPAARPERIS